MKRNNTDLLQYFDPVEYFNTPTDNRALKNDNFNYDIFESLNSLFSPDEIQDLEIINQKFRNNFNLLTPVLLKKELERLTVEFSWKSSQIEGNTYTLLDTEILLKEDIPAKGHTMAEATMILNHKRALDYIYQYKNDYNTLNLSKIEDIHRILTTGLDVSTGLRPRPVGITGTKYRPPDNIFQIKEVLQKLVQIINNADSTIEKALIAILMLSYIQPFEDGNKRTARLVGNAMMLAGNYCPLSYRSVDEIEYKKAIIIFYEQNSALYFKKLFVEQFKQAVNTYF